MIHESSDAVLAHPDAGAAPHRSDAALSDRAQSIVTQLGDRCLVLVGMMGAGKTSLGRRLAARLRLPFADADAEIETAAAMSIPEIFERHGEAEFRDGERRVLCRLLAEGPRVIATGGGSFMHPGTRERIAERGVSVWLKANFDILIRRVRKRANRPLLQTADPEATLRRLMAERYPIYALADVTVVARDAAHEVVVEEVLQSIGDHLEARAAGLAGMPIATGSAPPARNAQSESLVVPVQLEERAYDIVIGQGLIASCGDRIAALAPGSACAIVTDDNVARHHLAALESSLAAAGIAHQPIIVPAGEGSKSFARYAEVCDAIIATHLERRDVVVALGGGVVGDLAGFAAATVRRGMRVVQVPTSLLAQVDSSVGGKTGINSTQGKNLVGAFHQPSLVLVDVGLLDTLPAREFRAGYAEVVKYGLIGDAAFFQWLEASWRTVFAGGAARVHAIAKSCATKAGVVARDETEMGERALLNLGHTFAHAFERLTHYDGSRLVHGEAVAIGIACAFRFSRALGHCGGDEAGRVEAHLEAVGLPTRIGCIKGWSAGADAIVEAMHQDKKVERGRLTFILARGIGGAFVAKNVETAALRMFLDAELTGS